MSLKKFAPHLVLTTHKPSGLYTLFLCVLFTVALCLWPVSYNTITKLVLCSFLILGVYAMYRLHHHTPNTWHIHLNVVQKNEQSYVLDAVNYYFSSVIVLTVSDEQGHCFNHQITRWHVSEKTWRELVVYVRLRTMHMA